MSDIDHRLVGERKKNLYHLDAGTASLENK